MAGILVAGAINTDLVATVDRAPDAGETITGRGFAIYGGGKGANQAVAAARSGSSVALIGAVGDDDFGRARRADLMADGIDTSWVRTSRDVASGVALITVEQTGENRISYIPGATRTVSTQDAVAAVETIRPAIVLATNELPREALSALVQRAQELDETVIFNAAPDPESGRELLPYVDILILNKGEAHALAGMDFQGVDDGALVHFLQQLGPRQVVITLGAGGAIASVNDEVVAVAPPVVEVVDTTGAGDTFCGALAASLEAGNGMREAVSHAIVASALSVQRAGAQSSIPSRLEVERFVGSERREPQEIPGDPIED